jgi:hypothetical protein
VESDSSIVVGWLSHGNMLLSSSLFQLSLSSSFKVQFVLVLREANVAADVSA